MHSVLFSIKRVFHKSHWHGRGLLDPLSLTPSRFDILYILKTRGMTVWQSRIRKILGIAGPTLTLMIQALERLRFIERRGSEIDRRQIDVSLTDLGRRVVQCAIEIFIESGVIQNEVNRFLAPDLSSYDGVFEAVEGMDDALRRMRPRLWDRATLSYPWHPED